MPAEVRDSSEGLGRTLDNAALGVLRLKGAYCRLGEFLGCSEVDLVSNDSATLFSLGIVPGVEQVEAVQAFVDGHPPAP